MDGVRADVDGIRAVGELARRQAQHVAAMEEYMHGVCRASGAFGGFSVLNMFQGTYEKAFGYVSEGVQGSRLSNQKVAESLDACAAAYEAADRGVYDAFKRLAGGAGFDIGGYQGLGSGNSSVGPGACVPFNPEKDAAAEEGGNVLEDTAAPVAQELIGAATRPTEVHNGQVRFTPDPAGKAGPPGRASANTHHTVTSAAGAYEGVIAVRDFTRDPYMGVGQSVDEFNAARDANSRYQDIADRETERSALNWTDQP